MTPVDSRSAVAFMLFIARLIIMVGANIVGREEPYVDAGSSRRRRLVDPDSIVRKTPVLTTGNQMRCSTPSRPHKHAGGAKPELYRLFWCRRLFPFVLLMLDILLTGTAMAQSSDERTAEFSLSVIEIPARLSLDRLFEAAEEEIPRETGNWRNWRQSFGIDTKYRAWRGPLHLAMHGQVLTVQAQVAYWIRARKRVFGTLDLQSSCGVEEPPRRAVIGVQIRLDWAPDWTLHPVFRVMPTRFLDRCEMTVADIDVTPLIEREFQTQLQDKMRTVLRTLAPRLADLRHNMERNWLSLQQPVELWPDQWLLLNPSGVALSPLVGYGNTVDARLALVMQPRIVSDPALNPEPRSLPPLMRFVPRSTGANMEAQIDLDFARINQSLNEQFPREALEIQGHLVDIVSLEVGGRGKEIEVKARLGGDIAGNVGLKANVLFVPESQLIRVEDLKYDYEPDDPLLQAEAGLFYGVIRRRLESVVNQELQRHMEGGRKRLYGLIEKVAPEDTKLSFDTLQLRDVQLDVAEERLRVHGVAFGYVLVEFLQ